MPGFLTSIFDTLGTVGARSQNVFDNIFPPERRAEALKSLRLFAANNPKLAAFLAAQIAFTGLPLLLFLTFSVTIFVFSLITVLLIGVITALLFTVSMAGLALLVFLPTAFFTTFAGTFLFLWGMGAYYIYQRVAGSDTPTARSFKARDSPKNIRNEGGNWLVEWDDKEHNDAKNGSHGTPRLGREEQRASLSEDTSFPSEHCGNSAETIRSVDDPSNPLHTSGKQVNDVHKQTQDLSHPEKTTDDGYSL